jgi:hypothetical protein
MSSFLSCFLLPTRSAQTSSVRHSRSPARFCLSLACAGLALPLAAQVPQSVGYQGRVLVDGEPFSGTGLFKFALVDDGVENAEPATASAIVTASGFVTDIEVTAPGKGYVAAPEVTITGGGGSGAQAVATVSAGKVTAIQVTQAGSGYTTVPTVTVAPPPPAYVTFWSHDGTSADGAAPHSAVSLAVSGGLFSLALGDASLGMIPLGLEAFERSPIFLRVWFDDGINGFAQLAPDQPIAAAPYALRARMAAAVAEGAVGPEQIAGNLGVWLSGAGGISAGGPVGIGTGSPMGALQVVGSVVLGANGNSATGDNSFVSGGSQANPNRAAGDFSFIGGGANNVAAEWGSFVGGGWSNAALRTGSFVGGGLSNTASGLGSFVGGGQGNNADGWGSFVGGGESNTASGNSSFIAGGSNNRALGNNSFAAGQRARAHHDSTFVWADNTNADFASTGANQFLIRASGGVGIGTNAPKAALHVVGSAAIGSSENTRATGKHSFAAGGRLFEIVLENGSVYIEHHDNVAWGDYSFVGGGTANNAGWEGFVGGGHRNSAAGSSSFIGGGRFNIAVGDNSFIAGGYANWAEGNNSFAAGNNARARHDGTFVWADNTNEEFRSNNVNQFLIRASGGVGIGTNAPKADLHVLGSAAFGYWETSATGKHSFATGGGLIDHLGWVSRSPNRAQGDYSFVGGGVSNHTIGPASFVAGGENNTASGSGSFIAGGFSNKADGYNTFAAGSSAYAKHNGAFVWADSSSYDSNSFADFESVRPNQFLVRATGGVHFETGTRGLVAFSNNTGVANAAIQAQSIHAGGIAVYGLSNSTDSTLVLNNTGSGPLIKAFKGGTELMRLENSGDLKIRGTYSQLSDRNGKTGIEQVDPAAVLAAVAALPISEWSYRHQDGERHVGPMAQDFHAAFGLGSGDTSIGVGDLGGIALAAIQGLDQALKAQLAELTQRNDTLAERNAELEARLARLERLLGGEELAAR